MKINWFLLVTIIISGAIMVAPLIALYQVIIRI